MLQTILRWNPYRDVRGSRGGSSGPTRCARRSRGQDRRAGGRSGLELVLFQQLVLEPLERLLQPRAKGAVIVAAARDDLELVLDSRSGQGLIHGLSLLQRDDLVTVAVNDQ